MAIANHNVLSAAYVKILVFAVHVKTLEVLMSSSRHTACHLEIKLPRFSQCRTTPPPRPHHMALFRPVTAIRTYLHTYIYSCHRSKKGLSIANSCHVSNPYNCNCCGKTTKHDISLDDKYRHKVTYLVPLLLLSAFSVSLHQETNIWWLYYN